MSSLIFKPLLAWLGSELAKIQVRQKLACDKYRRNNSEKVRKRDREGYSRRRTARLVSMQAWKNKNREKIRAYGREYFKVNKEARKKAHATWLANNQDKTNKTKREWAQKRRDSDAGFRLSTNLRIRIWEVLKGNKKSAKTAELIGCSIIELRQHLEKQFQSGMGWDNYGRKGWHVDHIKPCARFNLSDPAQQKICFHYSNLRPLWALDNIRKGVKCPT